MGKDKDHGKQVENTSGGHEMGGTKFGQTPGEANHAPHDSAGRGDKAAAERRREQNEQRNDEADERPDPGRTAGKGMQPVERDKPVGRGERAS